MGAAENLSTDLESEEFHHGAQQEFWKLVERVGLKVYVRMYAPDNRTYLLALDCESYGSEPIRGLFVDSSTRQCAASAWPTGNETFAQWVKFAGSDLFVCWNQDRGGIEHHTDWRALKAWMTPNQLVSYLNFIRELLHLKIRGYARATT